MAGQLKVTKETCLRLNWPQSRIREDDLLVKSKNSDAETQNGNEREEERRDPYGEQRVTSGCR